MAFDAYNKGINAHLDWVFSLMSSTDAAGRANFNTERAAYLKSSVVAQTSAALTLSDIMTQKYISMFVHGHMESWVDMRRYKYSPDIFKGFVAPTGSTLFPDNNGKLAYRLRPRYNSEYVWNRAALDKIGALNADYHTKEIWFMQP